MTEDTWAENNLDMPSLKDMVIISSLSWNYEIRDTALKLRIKLFGPVPINNVKAYYLEDGEIVKRFRKDVYPPTAMGI